MARRLFFVDEVRRGAAEIVGEEARHLTRVLRVEPGQVYEISDNSAVYLAEIESARKEHVVFRVLEPVGFAQPRVKPVLMPALIKFERFEWLIEKATELGAEAIVPVISERSEHGLDRAAAKRIDRWRRIAVESAQQARRPKLPSIELPVTLDAALARPAGYRFFFDELPGAPALLGVLPDVHTRKRGDVVAILVGPEGGWVQHERDAAARAYWQPASLGTLVLRAETAAMAALSVIDAAWQVKSD